jgi:Fe-S cluster assembly protein SufD
VIINRESVKELTTKLSEPTWLADSRLEAWEAYLQRPMPTVRDEDWRRTDVGSLDLTRLQTETLRRANLDAVLQHFTAATELTDELKQQGVTFCDIATAVEKHGDKVRGYVLDSESAPDKFSLLNRALFNSGVFVHVPRNVAVSTPLLIGLELADDAVGEGYGAAVFPRLIVVAEDNSSVDVIVYLKSRDGAVERAESSLASALVDVHVKPGARVNYLEVQDFAHNVFYVERLNSNVDRDGTFNSLSIAMGGKQTKADIATYLEAPGSNSSVLGAVLGSERSKFSYNTIQEHNAPDTTSDINFRVALKDKSSSVYQGIIRVDKTAQRTNAFQSNKNLLLGGDAKADSIPKLEILADDVKCSHGATVGPVDREQLFYLRSRGLTEIESEQLVVLGFFRKVLEQFPVASTMDWLTEVISEKITSVRKNG